MATFTFDHTYARDLEGLFVDQDPVPVDAPALVKFNYELAAELGIDVSELAAAELATIFAGNKTPEGAHPIAQAYAGHQFGSYNPQLGDGRQVILGEVTNRDGQRFDVALKGSGRTPFSRGGDGRALIGPVLREYLMAEAMQAFGVPTTRALAAVTTGDQIRRQRVEPGAILTRVAASHLRVGTFQFAAATGDTELLRRLVDYALERHGPVDLNPDDNAALSLLAAVSARQATLIAQWMHLGFIHGVMNTDNCTISGETIDYGPCAFMEAFDPQAVFSSIDQHGRYAYNNQPTIALWNMARLAETLLPLIDEDTEAAVEAATAVLDTYQGIYDSAWTEIARVKLGAPTAERQLARDFLDLLAADSVDHTLAWRRLADAAAGDDSLLRDLFDHADPLDAWLAQWDQVVDRSPGSVTAMRAVSPMYIPRNHLVEAALTAAVEGDYEPFERLYQVVANPFEERSADAEFANPAPPAFTENYMTFCGT